jgi:hypothetical protein
MHRPDQANGTAFGVGDLPAAVLLALACHLAPAVGVRIGEPVAVGGRMVRLAGSCSAMAQWPTAGATGSSSG